MKIRKRYTFITLFGVPLLIWWLFFALPRPLFDAPYSTVLVDRSGALLSAHIASDGQWRFPARDSIPPKYVQALICFEDRYFYRHPGVNPFAIVRAMRQNIKEKRLVSGASTISMQVIRLAESRKGRALWDKCKEVLKALRLELRYSKQEILSFHAAHAPFGGNLVGLEAASWRYFGRSAHQLSWAETAMLAVLPNAPNLIHPGKHRKLLLAKRNRLLARMVDDNILSTEDYRLALLEPLPDRPHPIPSLAPHLLDRLHRRNTEKQYRTSLDLPLQNGTRNLVKLHHKRLSQNGIYNACALIIDIRSNKVLSYVANTPTSDAHAPNVDIIIAPRSTGSILKPFLYAAAMQSGLILPKSLLPDVPTQIAGYVPYNFDRDYDGAVPADEALSRSLNIPAVRLLQDYGVSKFYDRLKELGLSDLNYPADHYGLSLILGGAEASLWDLATAYTMMARKLHQYQIVQGQNKVSPYDDAPSLLEYSEGIHRFRSDMLPDAASVWLTFEAMTQLKKPSGHRLRDFVSGQRKIAWKTGTSFGFRDAWSIGVTPDYLVAVWVGNADGEGRPGLIGVEAAAPLMFDLFDQLAFDDYWFEAPYDQLRDVAVCRQSGYLATGYCTLKDTMAVHKSGRKTSSCPYHQRVSMDKTNSYRVSADCYPPHQMVYRSCFALPPSFEVYYKKNHPQYVGLPEYDPNCSPGDAPQIELIYPPKGARIYLPRNLDGSEGKFVFEAAHQSSSTKIYWHLDEEYIGSTQGAHQLQYLPKSGAHILTLIDQNGQELRQAFFVERNDTGSGL